ncbi:hypothetical protein COY52_08760 [Candidatus Desantisbacteria bacterium CG_4_10_14_0_8_um_filter_48_22]|uniref:FecR protein domain-containing protein n=1 Tax=Candidatus Desantisbacteria bacterium CG_4_10_14_0_8_um_filter_48_22 TaxID=1974543 RepID=A0A2M7S8J5_9BACT|nr:MAG: hypothetical protein AUJ67_09725 [Candidatus Desantisbacteria bacterium CG1_02_49_89]PIV57304.1 MAG: hypothetical protein COS16_00875 [Candidatus Desantisbacteria bacterium CG02_land_8_20_14_3_00_49_13]PIZ15810.1 MAG: hypothetical protein COY52_08760 [Candidatus Desantisbacteria bacterium CG_4_10_14_0_8_um_filter_48_22]
MRNTARILSAGIACFLFLAALQPALGSERLTKLIYIEGIVEVQKPGARFAKAELDMQLGKGDVLRTGSGSIAELELDDGSFVKIGEESTIGILALEEVGPGKDRVSLFKLILGEIKATIQKALGRQASFEVQTAACIAGVRGTDFTVTAEGDEAADVEVLEGSVAVEGLGEKGERGALSEVKAGQSTRVEKGKPPMAVQKIEAYRRARWELFAKKKKIFNSAKELEKAKIAADFLRVKYAQAEGESRKALLKQAEGLKKAVVKTALEMEKANKDFIKDKEKLDRETAKAVADWKRLPPEKRAKARMNYEIWKSTAPQPAFARRDRMKEILENWKDTPPQVKAVIIRAHKAWNSLKPELKKAIILKVRQFSQLPPWVKKKIVDNCRRWKGLQPEVKKRMVENYGKWKKLPPEKREDIKDRIEDFKNLPPEKKLRILKLHKMWQKVPPKMRMEWMKKHAGKPPKRS